MKIPTTRFGLVEVLSSDLIEFPQGLIGMESCHRWVLLADAESTTLGWLQSTERPEIALAVVSPRRFVSGYQARVSRRDVESLELDSSGGSTQVLSIVSHGEEGLTLNLKAPLVINIDKRVGRQVVTKDDHAVQYALGTTIPFRRSA